jgi:hypothetical protein
LAAGFIAGAGFTAISLEILEAGLATTFAGAFLRALGAGFFAVIFFTGAFLTTFGAGFLAAGFTALEAFFAGIFLAMTEWEAGKFFWFRD